MALPYPFSAGQTDAKSPIDEQLMYENYQLNIEWLETQIAAGGGGAPVRFVINGPLDYLRIDFDPEFGKAIDGAVVPTATTYTRHRLYLKDPGDEKTGTLECDVRRIVEVEHGVTKVESQYLQATQSIAHVGSSISTTQITRSTTQINTQSITRVKASKSTQSVVVLENNLVRYNFSGAALDSDYRVGDTVVMSSHTSANNDGEFLIVSLNDDGFSNITVENSLGVDQAAAAGNVDLQFFSYNYAAPVNAEFTVGEKADFLGHTAAANNGQFEIVRINDPGNNILVYNPTTGATTQGGIAGTADVLRFVYTFAAPAPSDYAVGDTALMASHTSAVNDGNLAIVAVNSGGNNVVVYNENGTPQGGAAGTVDTNRWQYNLPTDPSTDNDVQVGDLLVFRDHTNSNNDGSFIVKEVNRSATNNVVILNESGVAQGGVAGTTRHQNHLYWFTADYSASYEVSTAPISYAYLTGCADDANNGTFICVQTNRGLAGSYNIVVENPDGVEQLSPAGAVVSEIQSIFTTTPTITDPKDKYQVSSNGVLAARAVPAEARVVFDVLSILDGSPEDITLTLEA